MSLVCRLPRIREVALRRGEPISFSPYLYRARNLVERFFNKIKQCRRIIITVSARLVGPPNPDVTMRPYDMKDNESLMSYRNNLVTDRQPRAARMLAKYGNLSRRGEVEYSRSKSDGVVSLNQRNCRAHAGFLRFIACGGDNASLGRSADRDRLSA
jgi:transposase